MALKYKIKKIIEVSDWDKVVKDTYGRPYSFQQQDGCKDRGTFEFTVPNRAYDFRNDIVPEEVNCDEMGVSFSAWLKRDPKLPLVDNDSDFSLKLWWERNFYPEFQMIANDLHSRGLLEAGDYTINIDW
jgi:hypothetical protein